MRWRLLALACLLMFLVGFKGVASFAPVPNVPEDEDGTWEVLFDPINTLNYTEPAGSVNYRTVMETPAGGPWTKIRVTVIAESTETTEQMTGSVCIRSGTTDDCTASPTQLLWSASSTVAIGTGETIASDDISFSFNSADSLLINTHTLNGEGRYLWVGGVTAYWKAGADDTMTQNVSYSTDPHQWNIELVEGWNPD